ncbi:DNA-directed DNA polymerase alpha subunit POL12 KNAG_0H00880 [Huiozyma naganishii CBS 8797]|uniref:DNA polymerase alpha subunit B n=1 Tax=Huiozyma naganishii (strain ATCC MYA-139 / BCRC 22969 / CBS 8797 / KCTC 17520 / NBRC 10181 / NCYC 3082 / Yp74L-3) TaxID=1071383 RepID=J7RPA8_HUIN7|nr:hypothetical protein KNAG_0H00880 [Kazachstania naganishii CBS 8797]CCK71503.1 hypothetical protein KNAG_0H00880 [Kazachstania naganishii CBS 8797]
MVQGDNLIVSKFGVEAAKPEIKSLLENLSSIYAITLEDLYIKWEQFSINQKHETSTELNLKNLDEFKQFLQAQMEKHAASVENVLSRSIKTGNTSLPSIKKPKQIRGITSGSSLFGFNVPKTPQTNKKQKVDFSADGSSSKLHFIKTEGETSVSDIEIKSEDNSKNLGSNTGTPLAHKVKSGDVPGRIIDSLNPENIEIAVGINTEEPSSEVKIQPYYDPSKYKFRIMRQNLVESSEVLNEQIEIFTKLVQAHLKLTDSDFGDPTIQSQNVIYAVGRIVPDSPSAEGFLNEQSLSLETSRLNGIGRRIRLKLDNISDTSLFVGQIVALKGSNANGEAFLVEDILDMPYPDAPVSTEEDINLYKNSLKGESAKIVVTAGPYFPDNSLDISYLSDFVERVNNESKPHIVIMYGPFIDVTNSMIMEGRIPTFPHLKVQPRTLDELFTRLVLPILKNINPKIQVILIPSTRDVSSNHSSYPQDSFDRKGLQLPKNFKCFTNPSTFQLNETFFGCSNADIFKDMKEILKGGDISMRNRFDRIAEHMLQQRRFYPVFPGSLRSITVPAKNENSKKIHKHISGVDLEVSYLGLTEFVGNFAPDVIMVPSDMSPFARVVKNVVFINPGKFVKARGARGTHAQISICCPNLEDRKLTKLENDEVLYLHNVWKRSRVDIVGN